VAAIGRPSSTKRFLLLLVVLAASLLVLSTVQRDRALRQVFDEAQRRAVLYTGTVLRSFLRPDDVAGGELPPERAQALQAELRGFVLTDPAVVRVRLWAPAGTLLFSTDPADRPGEASSDEAIGLAVGGRVGSRLTEAPVSGPTVGSDGSAVSLFETFAPLRLPQAIGIAGASEIDQSAAVLQDRADDPWWIVRTVASAVTILLAFLAFISVARGIRRPREEGTERRGRASRREGKAAGFEGDHELQDRLAAATARAKEAESSAKSYATRVEELTRRLETVEGMSSDERIEELKEELRRSEAERAMLRAGRPETQQEAEMRRIRADLRDAQVRAKAAEALAGGADQVSVVQEQLAAAARQVDAAVERAKAAEGRADGAEDRARVAGELVTAAEQRIDLLEAKLQEIAEAGIAPAEDPGATELRRQLEDARASAAELERRAVQAESALAAARTVVEGPSEEALAALEQRVMAAEQQAREANSRARAVEDLGSEREAAFRERLGMASSGRKYGVAPRTEEEEAVDLDLRAAIARGIRGPLTRATGLVLSLQGAVGSAEGRDVLRQLSNSLRRLDRLAADLHDVERIADGTLPINRRKTDLAALVETTVDETDRLEDRLVRVDADRVQVSVDPDRVRQIVEGMLDAARERTRSGAAIVVRVRDTEAGARISVEDDNRTPAVIGPELSLAVHLAELHGTEITPDASSFRVVFPRDDGIPAS
jgi:hypothetical protein